METFGILGFIFGLIAFTTVLNNSKQVKELKVRIKNLENKEK